MNISPNIPLDANAVLIEIAKRQGAPWNNGRINDHHQFPNLQKLMEIINSGIPKEDFFYQGDLFRLHTSHGSLEEWVNPEKEQIIGKVCSDGSCSVLPFTEYSDKVVAFSKSCDFTNRKVFYKVCGSESAILIHLNTGCYYGIDVNCLQQRFDISTRYAGEQEVLFPLFEECVIKEYHGTPNKFKYYLRKFSSESKVDYDQL